MSKPITITTTLTDDQAWQLAQFIKRIGFNTVLSHTDGNNNKAEAYVMLAALDAVRSSLAEAGYAPR